jgi:hypothetical protein
MEYFMSLVLAFGLILTMLTSTMSLQILAMIAVPGDTFRSYLRGATIVIISIVTISILTFTIRPLGRIGDVHGAAHNGFAAAAAVQLPGELNLNAPVQPLPQPQIQAQAHGHFLDPINPLEYIDEDVQAAHNQFQLQLQEANRVHNANRHLVGGQDLQAQVRRMDEETPVRRRRVQGMEERYGELRRRRGQDLGARPPRPAPHPAQPVPYPIPVPWFGLGGPPVDVEHAGAGAAVGAGLAFGGLDANRALDVDRAARKRE